MKPKRFVIAVYRDTQTHKNIYDTQKTFLLQALAPHHASLVVPLGKKSGKTYNKAKYLEKKAPGLKYFESCSYLPDSFFVLALTPEAYIPVGDHDLIIGRVTTVVLPTSGGVGLTTDDLQKAKLIL